MGSSLDTIAAAATPTGVSAIAVVRASGPLCRELAESLAGSPPPPRVATRADYRDHAGTLLDDVLITFFAAPQSYTGDDTIEISCHGNPLIAQKILEDLLARGCRSAEPGEFTRRAFTHGRLDLSQAEAVMDLIHARSERALTAANQQLRGSLGRHMAELTDQLLLVLAHVEAYIDFPEEDLPGEDRGALLAKIERLSAGTQRLLATQHYGELLRDGIKTVIIGEPNAGKSSLLNRLVGRDRALVSPEPGTTRDFIEERIILGAHALRLIDTAGLNPSPGDVERLGIQKTLERAAEADLLLLVLDATRPHPAFVPELEKRFNSPETLVVINKIDLADEIATPALSHNTEVVRVSALTGDGLQELIGAIIRRAETRRTDTGDEIIAVNARHANALTRAKDYLHLAAQKIERQEPVELLASDLRCTLDAFGEIAGRVDNDRMLDHLFATFCIGK
jgi:tRNA modification GTPase